VRARPQDEAEGEEVGTLTFVDTPWMRPRNHQAERHVSNLDHKLWPGQFVRVTLRLTTQANAVVVRMRPSKRTEWPVYLRGEGGHTVEARPVTTGARVEQEMVVEQGLEPGETVVTKDSCALDPTAAWRCGTARATAKAAVKARAGTAEELGGVSA